MNIGKKLIKRVNKKFTLVVLLLLDFLGLYCIYYAMFVAGLNDDAKLCGIMLGVAGIIGMFSLIACHIMDKYDNKQKENK